MGRPLLVFDRTSLTASEEPVCYQKRFSRADCGRYRLTLEGIAPGESAIQSFAPILGG
jgi:hypothetical protein